MKYRKVKDQLLKTLFKIATILSASMVILIFVFIFNKGIRVFLPSYPQQVSLSAFLTGLSWRVETQSYGVFFIFVNTILTAFFAALIAFPISVLSALYIVKIAPKRLSNILTTVVELLAAIPSVVYGVFAAGVIVNLVENLAAMLNYSSFAGRSMLAVILLLSIMIMPTMISLSIVSIRAVSKDLEWSSLALGASQTETNFKLVLPAAKSGIFSGLILALSRAFGEATAVSMVAGNRLVGPTFNPFNITRTLTSTMLAGLSETSGLDYDIRFSVGIVLMLTIFVSNWTIHRFEKRITKGGQS